MKTNLKLLSASLLLVLCNPMITEAQNPIVPEGEFLSDPQPRVFADGKVYVYGSRDVGSTDWCGKSNDVLVSTSLNRWTLHKDILRSGDITGLKAPLFAPDCICKGGKYYLFYCTPDDSHKEGIAVSDSPCGPFKEYASLPKCKGIDPSVFQDDDGQIYYFWGQYSLKCAKLKPDLSGIDESTIVDNVLTEKEHHFHEGSQAFKRNGIYYLSFADISRRHPTCIGYATAKSPTGPYTYRGVIIDNDGSNPAVWNNHGAVAEVGGRWYVFYHRPSNGVITMRKACVEPITFDDCGLIKEVEMTSQGAGKPLDGGKAIAARLACWMKGNVRVTTYPGGREVLSGIQNKDSAVYRYVHFAKAPTALHVDVSPQAGGKVRVYARKAGIKPLRLAELTVRPARLTGSVMDRRKVSLSADAAALRGGDYTISLSFEGKGKQDLMTIHSFRFE